MAERKQFLAYYYPAWHFDPLRNPDPSWSEWDIVLNARPRAAWHRQPLIPALGPRRDDDPANIAASINLAQAHGIDGFIGCFYWNQGSRMLEKPLRLIRDAAPASNFSFALMWANKSPYFKLPMRPGDENFAVVDGQPKHIYAADRLVKASADDFLSMIDYLCDTYFAAPGYITINGSPLLQIFSVEDLLRDLKPEEFPGLIAAANARMRARGWNGLHLAANVHNNSSWYVKHPALGFTSLTSYVLLPDWSGPTVQDYSALAAQREREWISIRDRATIPYSPSVTVGWDSSARGTWLPISDDTTFPWRPIITGATPDAVRKHLIAAAKATQDGLVRITSWNEWSEGHYLEPDTHQGTAMLEAVAAVRRELGW